jgi:hypothetical protein
LPFAEKGTLWFSASCTLMVEKHYGSFVGNWFYTNRSRSMFVREKKRRKKPPAFIILYVDDGGIFGTPKTSEMFYKLCPKC